MKKGFSVFFLIAVSFAAAYLLCIKIIPEHLFPSVSSSLSGGKESFQIISAEPGTQLQLVWAYEAKVQRSQRQKIENYQRVQDLSFKRFQTDKTWIVSDEGYLQSGEQGAVFSFSYPKFTNNVFVFCLKVSYGLDGQAMVVDVDADVAFFETGQVSLQEESIAGILNIGLEIGNGGHLVSKEFFIQISKRIAAKNVTVSSLKRCHFKHGKYLLS